MRIKVFFMHITAGIFLFSLFVLTGCGGGGGGSSSPSAPTIPPAPSNLVVAANDGYNTLSWSAVSGTTSYNLYWSKVSGVNKTNGNKITGVVSPQNIAGLVNGTPYYYTVTAVNSTGESAESIQASATPVNGTSIAETTYYSAQWHLKNTGQPGATGIAGKIGEDINVEPAWIACGTGNTCRGEGVRIAVVDGGLEIGHEDLVANIATGLSYNYVTGSSDPTETDPTDNGHGTMVGGIIAARDMNGLGGRGVAPRANLVGYNYLKSTTLSNQADAMTRGLSDVSVSNNSWAPNAGGEGLLRSSSLLWQSAINTGLNNGRGGKGIIYLFAGGNGATGDSNSPQICPRCVDNSNYNGFANFGGVIAVGAVTDKGTKSSYSERGANLWVSAPGGEYCDTHTITTTDRTGTAGMNSYNDLLQGYSDYANTKYTKCMNGTSAATPMAAGVAALMLQANPNLGWRDVKIIFAQTARVNDSTPTSGWTINGAGYWINHNYGFGVVDANAAVAMAKTWVNVGTLKNYATAVASPNLAIPDNNTTGVSHTITVSGSGITKIEWIEITFSAADHPYSGDLDISLTNNTFGTTSRLAETHFCANDLCNPYNGWIFGSARHLGEPADGTWTLTVKDLSLLSTGTFQSWSLKFYGT